MNDDPHPTPTPKKRGGGHTSLFSFTEILRHINDGKHRHHRHHLHHHRRRRHHHHRQNQLISSMIINPPTSQQANSTNPSVNL